MTLRHRLWVLALRSGLVLLYLALLLVASAVPVQTVAHYRSLLESSYARYQIEQLGLKPGPTPVVAQPQEPSQLVSLELLSEPSEAHVYVNSVYQGRTPLQISSLPPGSHHIRLARYPFQDIERNLELESSRSLRYELPQRQGEIQLIGPKGVQVRINGQDHGVLPQAALTLPIGPHEVELQLGSRRWGREVVVEENLRLHLDVLSNFPKESPSRSGPDQEESQILVDAIPWGEVFIDGESRGFSPVLISGLAPGSHELEIRRRGYESEKRWIHLKEGQKARVTVRLRRN